MRLGALPAVPTLGACRDNGKSRGMARSTIVRALSTATRPNGLMSTPFRFA
jgi:hypothetical protein